MPSSSAILQSPFFDPVREQFTPTVKWEWSARPDYSQLIVPSLPHSRSSQQSESESHLSNSDAQVGSVLSSTHAARHEIDVRAHTHTRARARTCYQNGRQARRDYITDRCCRPLRVETQNVVFNQKRSTNTVNVDIESQEQ